MNILMVSPKFLITFWSWEHLLWYVGKKAAFPPLGLLTVAGMLPLEWNLSVVDLNVVKLQDWQIRAADYVFVGAMTTQAESARQVIARCKKLGAKVVLGGPILEAGAESFPEVDCCVFGEAERLMPIIVADMEAGVLKKEYRDANFPELGLGSAPRWDLVNLNDYASAILQYGRGCPYRCSYCNVAMINGRVPRHKNCGQFLCELEDLYATGYRGPVLLADDNLIGHKAFAKQMLAELVSWQQSKGYPFEFTAEMPVNIAGDRELLSLLAKARFKKIFLGIETPNKEALEECGKTHNSLLDLKQCVENILRYGLIPMSGFIWGFDADKPGLTDKQMVEFIQEAGIVIAMVGVLQASKGSELEEKMRKEGRLLSAPSGNNTDCYPNFRPLMPLEDLVSSYKWIVTELSRPGKYAERVLNMLRHYGVNLRPKKGISWLDFKAFLKSVLWIGVLGGYNVSRQYWRTLWYAIRNKPRAFPDTVACWIYREHLKKVAKATAKS